MDQASKTLHTAKVLPQLVEELLLLKAKQKRFAMQGDTAPDIAERIEQLEKGIADCQKELGLTSQSKLWLDVL